MFNQIKSRLSFLICMSFLTTSWVSAEEYNGTLDLFESSPALKPYFDNSFGYAVFPRVGKGGVIFGASHGKGKVYRLGEVVGSVELNEFTLGFEFGGQSFSDIIFFQDERALMSLPMERSIDASVSAAAVTLGLQAQLGTGGTSQVQEKVLLQRNRRIMAIARALRYSFTLEAG